MTSKLSAVRGKTMKTLLLGLFCLLTVVGLWNVALHAQTLVSAIQGTVTDSTGAVVPGATIAATNVETGLQRTVTSNSAGIYVVTNLPPGRYRVQVSLTGFQTNVRENIALVVGQQLVLNTALKVGEITQQVEVTGEAPLVDTSTAQVAGLVGERQVKDMPLNGRSFDNLITLNPAMVNTSAVSPGASSSTGPGQYFSIGGRRPGENVFLWNGVEFPGGTTAESSTPGGVSGQLLGVDAVREFNVVPNIDSAEFGHRAGGQVGVVTSSGTNVLHGSVFEFLRNSVLDARNFFDAGAIPPFKRNQFGGSLGGPIQKDKMFVFGNYEGFRERLGLSRVANVPDAQAQRGFLPCNVVVNNPAVGFVKPPCTGTELVNVGLKPEVVPYFGLWPEVNGENLGGGAARSYNNPVRPIREDFGIVKVDRTISDRDNFSVSYTIDDGAKVEGAPNPLSILTLASKTQVLSLQEIHVFSPNVVNNFTAGYSRAWYRFLYSVSVAPAGVQPNVVGKPPGQINIGGAQGTGAITAAGSGPNTGHDQLDIDNIFSYSDQLHITRGIHSITTGGWAKRLQSNETNGNFGNMQFPNLQFFLQGTPTSFAVQSGLEVPWRVWLGAWFVQDAMKLRPNLTLSLGLRHEFTNGWNALNQRAGNFIIAPGGVMQGTTAVAGNSLFSKNRAKALWGPRAALAWDPFGKGQTSIRAGWGLMYNLLDNIGWCCRNMLGEAASYQVANPPYPFPTVPSSNQIPAALNPAQGGGAGGIQNDPYTPAVFNYRFEVEQGLGANMTLRLAYVGSRGYHEILRGDTNATVPIICSAAQSNCTPSAILQLDGTIVPNTIPDGTKFFPCSARLTPQNQTCSATAIANARRNPKFGSQAIFYTSAVNNFNAFYIDLNRRFRGGLAFRANYTYGKSLDNSSQITGSQAVSNQSTLMDPEDPMRDYGLSAFDVRNRFGMNASYELPIGSGKALLGGVTGVADKLVSGWQLNTILGLQGGFPFTPLLGFSQSRNGTANNFADRPDMKPGRTRKGIYKRTAENWIDATAFALPVPGTYGNAGRDILIGPGLVSLDASLFKVTRLTERWGLQFRAEFFNLLNRTNFGIPRLVMLQPSGVPLGNAGSIERTATYSRMIQFGMKLTF